MATIQPQARTACANEARSLVYMKGRIEDPVDVSFVAESRDGFLRELELRVAHREAPALYA